jgi:hypothetical protein
VDLRPGSLEVAGSTYPSVPPSGRNTEVLMAALRSALQRLMSVGAPDAGRVALVVRQMVGAAPDDEAQLAVFE